MEECRECRRNAYCEWFCQCGHMSAMDTISKRDNASAREFVAKLIYFKIIMISLTAVIIRSVQSELIAAS